MKNQNSITIPSKGRFSLRVLDSSGKETKRIDDTENVVTYAGAYHFLLASSNMLYGPAKCAVGTGSVERTRASTDLGVRVAPFSANQSNTENSRSGSETDNGDGTSTVSVIRKFTFGIGALSGTFSEVGMFSTGGDFLAGQLIKDEFGSPTTITILSDEQLIVTYTLEFTIPNTPSVIGTGSVTADDGTVYNYTVYNQPFFQVSTIGNSGVNQRIRAGSGSFNNEVILRGSSGGTVIHDSGSKTNGWSVSRVDGQVTLTNGPATFSPASFSTTDLKYIGFGSIASDIRTVNLATKEVANSYVSLLLEFDTPITKTSSDILSLTVDMVVNI